MESKGLDAIVATSPENVTYCSDFYNVYQWTRLTSDVQCYVILPNSSKLEPTLVAWRNDIGRLIANPPWIKQLTFYQANAYTTRSIFSTKGADESEAKRRGKLTAYEEKLYDILTNSKMFQTPTEALAGTLKEMGLSNAKIGIDEIGIPGPILDSARKKLPRAKISQAYETIREIRMVKTPEEISRVRQAAKINERAVQNAIKEIRPGATEQDLFAVYKESLVKDDALPSFTMILGGHRSLLSCPPSDYPLRKGDMIRFDVGCRYKHYCSDIARMAVIGEPSETLKTSYSAVLKGQTEVLEGIKPGVKASELYRRAVEAIRKSGLPRYAGYACGHGVGIEYQDPPRIAEEDQHTLEPNMTLSIEDPWFDVGFGCVQVEDTILVTPNGYERFTESSRELNIV